MLQLKIVNYQTGEFKQETLKPNNQEKLEWSVGRRADCDLILTSPEVSRLHGKFVWENDKYCFTDLGSSDGSRLNNQDIESKRTYPLQEKDLVLIGNFILTVDKIDNQPAIADKSPTVSKFNTSIPQWKDGDLTVKCQQIIQETPDVKTFRFVADPPVAFTYEPGQFVNLELEIAGKPVMRSYSISTTPSRPHTLDITVKRVLAPADAPDLPPGLVSNWLHDNLQVGSEVKLIGGAMGRFTCTTNPPPKILLISAGSGITPMISMSRWIYDTAANCDVVFFHNARTPQDIIMRQELEAIAQRLGFAETASRHPNFRLAISLTRPQEINPWENWFGLTGRFDRAMLHNIAPDFQQREVYVCGSNGFMKQVKQILADEQFPLENYHQESFGIEKQKITATKKAVPSANSIKKVSHLPILDTSEQKSAAPTSSQPCVVFAPQGEEIVCDPEESILEVAEQQGISIRSGCRQGVCGMCKKRKLEGNIRYEGEPDGLNSDSEDCILTCIAYPMDKVVIEA